MKDDLFALDPNMLPKQDCPECGKACLIEGNTFRCPDGHGAFEIWMVYRKA